MIMETTNWNDFMETWNNYHRDIIIPYIKNADKKQRGKINVLLGDMKSSLKWCRLDECVNILDKLYIIINQ